MFVNDYRINTHVDAWCESVWVIKENIPFMVEAIKDRSVGIMSVERTKIKQTMHGEGCYYVLTFKDRYAYDYVSSVYNALVAKKNLKEAREEP